MSEALRWVVVNHLGLKAEDWIMSVSDNTNSMSGTSNTGKRTGGVFFQVRRAYGFAFLPRFPCVLHVIHLAYTHARPILMGAPMPAQHDRECYHPWNYLYDLYKEFGLEGPDYREMKADLVKAMKQVGVNFTKSQKPIATRWAYEQVAVTWERTKRPLILASVAWQRDKKRSLSVRWKRIEKYATDSRMQARLLVMEDFGNKVVLQQHGRSKVDKTPRILNLNDRILHPSPAGMCAANMGEEFRRVNAQLNSIKQDPERDFGESLKAAENILSNAIVADEDKCAILQHLKTDLVRATIVYETWMRKWLGCLEHLPFVVCEFGGNRGKEFALAFLLAFDGELPLLVEPHLTTAKAKYEAELEASLTRTFFKQLQVAKQKHTGICM